VTWREYHAASSRAAAEAETAVRESARERAMSLYRQAAEAEERALSELDPGKQRTLGITAVSAVALWCKGGDFDRAKRLADSLAGKDLPSFATRQIGEILDALPSDSEFDKLESFSDETLRALLDSTDLSREPRTR